jgi:acetyl-CoA synthetase
MRGEGLIQLIGILLWKNLKSTYGPPHRQPLRMLMVAGDELLKDFKLSSLCHIISQGEALNPEVIRWGIENLGVRIHDNWWMTEAGSTICSNFRSLPIRPGSMGKPFPGIEVAILDNQGNKQPPYSMGNLAVRPP